MSVTFYTTNHFWHHYLNLTRLFLAKNYLAKQPGQTSFTAHVWGGEKKKRKIKIA